MPYWPRALVSIDVTSCELRTSQILMLLSWRID